MRAWVVAAVCLAASGISARSGGDEAGFDRRRLHIPRQRMQLGLPLPELLRLTVIVGAPSQPHETRGPLNRISDLQPAFAACFQALPADQVQASDLRQEVTLVFAFNRDGLMMAPPRVTYANLPSHAAQPGPFAVTAISALTRCAPLAFTPGFGSAIAGRPIAVRFIDPGPNQPKGSRPHDQS